MAYRMQLGPLPHDVTDAIFRSLGGEARARIVTLSKAFSLYFWARIADKHDMGSLMLDRFGGDMEERRAQEIVDAVRKNAELSRWCRESTYSRHNLVRWGLYYSPTLISGLFPETYRCGMQLDLRKIERSKQFASDPRIDATACFHETIAKVQGTLGKKAGSLVRLAVELLDVPTFSLYAVQDDLIATLRSSTLRKVSPSDVMTLLRHPDFDPSAQRNAWFEYLQGSPEMHEAVAFLVNHPRFQLRLLTRFQLRRCFSMAPSFPAARDILRKVIASDPKTKEVLSTKLFISEMSWHEIQGLVSHFKDFIDDEKARLEIVFRSLCLDGHNWSILDSIFDNLREWKVSGEEIFARLGEENLHATAVHHVFVAMSRYGYATKERILREVLRRKIEHPFLSSIVEKIEYTFPVDGYGVLGDLVESYQPDSNEDYPRIAVASIAGVKGARFSWGEFYRFIDKNLVLDDETHKKICGWTYKAYFVGTRGHSYEVHPSSKVARTSVDPYGA
jgi:hypothetical protein